MRKKKKNPFPKHLLNQIDEWANGGYILFNFDEDGVPEINADFADYKNALCLQAYASLWAKAMEENNVNLCMNSLADDPDDEDDFGDRDDYEDPLA